MFLLFVHVLEVLGHRMEKVILGIKMNSCDDSHLGPFLAQDCDDEIKGRNSYESFSEHLGKM